MLRWTEYWRLSRTQARREWLRRGDIQGQRGCQAVIEDYNSGQVNIYVDASVRNGTAGVAMYATPSKTTISSTVGSSEQPNTHPTEAPYN
jgi:hypothetical protein